MRFFRLDKFFDIWYNYINKEITYTDEAVSNSERSKSFHLFCYERGETTMNIEDIINILDIAVRLLNTIVDVILHTAQSYKSYKKKHRIKVEPPASAKSKAVHVCIKRKHH